MRIGLVDGPFGSATVTSVEPGGVSMRCEFELTTPARPRLDLLLRYRRPKVMRRLWSQLAALGVGQVILTNAARVERDYFGAHVLDPAVFTLLLIEGLQQARDTGSGGVDPPAPESAGRGRPGRAVPGRRCMVAQPGHDDTLDRVLAGAGPARMLLAVGPGRRLDRVRAGTPHATRLPRRGHGAAHAAERHRHHRASTLAHQALASRNAVTTND